MRRKTRERRCLTDAQGVDLGRPDLVGRLLATVVGRLGRVVAIVIVGGFVAVVVGRLFTAVVGWLFATVVGRLGRVVAGGARLVIIVAAARSGDQREGEQDRQELQKP